MASSRAYDIAFRLNGKLNKSYNESFSRAEAIADKAASRIKSAIIGIGSMVISTAAIRDFVDTYKEYQQEIYNTAATAGIDVGSEQYERLNEAALKAGKSTTKTATEAAQALNYMSLAGWDVNDSVNGLLPILRLSEATGADLATTSDLVTDSMAAMGVSVEDMTKYLDMAEMANNKSNQTALQMMEAVIKTGGIAKTVGIDMYDMGTALGILANNGVKAEEAGTAMNSMLVRMTSNDTALTAMEKLGVSAYDAQGNFRNLEDIFVDINKATAGMADQDKMAYLSDIAGTRYASKLVYLLDSVKEGANGAASEWGQLNYELENSQGALDRAVATQNSSLSARLKLLQSAWDDFKINVVEQSAPVLSEWISSLADKLPDMTENTVQFIHKASKYVGELWDKGKGLFNWASKNKNTLETVFAGIGSAIGAYKLSNLLADVGKGLTAIGAVAMSHPIIAGITLAAAAIGAIAYSVHEANKALGEASLTEHFGNIELTLSDIESISKGIFTDYEKWSDFANAIELVEEKYDSFIKAAREIDKYHYKVSIGVELTQGDMDSYESYIKEFTESAQSIIDNKQYAVSIAVNLLSGENSNIAEGINKYYTDVNAEFSKLGADLATLVNDAFGDKILSPDEAGDIAAKMQEIQDLVNEITHSQTEAKFEAAALRYSGSELTSESYKQMIDELNILAEESNANAQQAYAEEVGALDAMWKRQEKSGGSVKYFKDYNDYTSQREQAKTDYLSELGSNMGKVSEYANNTLLDTYGDEMIASMQKARGELQPVFDNLKNNDFLKTEAGYYGGDIESAVSAYLVGIENSRLHIDKSTQNAFKELYGSDMLEDLLSNAEIFKEAGVAIPENIMEGIKMQIESGVIAGDTNALMMYVYSQLYGYEELIGADLSNIGADMAERIAAGYESGAPEAAARIQSATSGMIDQLQALLNKNPLVFKYETGLPKGVQGPVQGTVVGIKGFARGTSYTPDTFIAGEQGPELITNSRGYRVYDSLATGRIYDNAAELWTAMTANREQSNSLAVSRQINKGNTTVNNGYSFSFTMPSITINGNADSCTVDQIKALLEQYKRETVKTVISELDNRADRERRVSNE